MTFSTYTKVTGPEKHQPQLTSPGVSLPHVYSRSQSRQKMNWLFGGTRSNLPEPTALQSQKTKQIEQLRKLNQNVSEIIRDVEYRVNCIVNGTSISLCITLPPQFPKEKPKVSVSPSVYHQWVNEQNTVIGCPGLNSFSVHSDLGKVIRSIVDEFHRHPPTLRQQQPFPTFPYPGTRPNLPHYGDSSNFMPYPGGPKPPSYMPQVQMPTIPAVSSSSSSAHSAPTVSTQPSISTHTNINVTDHRVGGYQMPEIPMVFSQLRDLSLDELRQLEEDEDKLLDLIRNLPEVQKISTDREEMTRRNEEIARLNLSRKPQLEEKKNYLLERFDHLNELRRNFDHLSQQQDELHYQFDPESIRDNLKVAALQAEEESETIAEKFLEGQIPVDEFRIKYMQKRTLSHQRRAKEEKMSQYLLEHRGGH